MIMFITVVSKDNNRPSLSLEVANDISFLVSKGYKNLLLEGSGIHGEHVPEPATAVTFSTVPSSISFIPV
jgi:hypothetical protein